VPFGLIVLFVVAALIYFGLAHRVLDRMRLTDSQALLFLGLMVAGSFVNVPLVRGSTSLSVNVGGAIVPAALAIYLLAKAGTTKERVRGVLAAVATAAAIWIISSVTDFEPPRTNFIDPIWLFSIVGGVAGYIAGRSRRSAFIAGTMGVILADLMHTAQVFARDIRSDVSIGGAGVFDAVVLAGLIAVGLAEVVGESRERLQGGPVVDGDRPEALRVDEGIADEDAPDEDASRSETDDHGDGSEGDTR